MSPASMPSMKPPRLDLQSNGPAQLQANAVQRNQYGQDFTFSERADLDMGSNMEQEFDNRIGPERQAALTDHALYLIEEYKQDAGRVRRSRQRYYLTYDDFGAIATRLGNSQGMNEIEKAFTWGEIIHQRDQLYYINNEGVNPAVIDTGIFGARAGNTHIHTHIPFEDNYHGRWGGVQGDENVDLSTVPVPSWGDQAYVNSLPDRDTKSEGPNRLSRAYKKVLENESKGGVKGWAGANRGDAEASFASIETMRSYRRGGFGAFASEWNSNMRR